MDYSITDQNGKPFMSYEDWKAWQIKYGMPPLTDPTPSEDKAGYRTGCCMGEGERV